VLLGACTNHSSTAGQPSGAVDPLAVNLSEGRAHDDGRDYASLLRATQQSWDAGLLASFRETLAAVASLPKSYRDNVVITIAAGNGHQPMAGLLSALEHDPVLSPILTEHVLIVGASNYPLSNYAPDDPNVAMVSYPATPDGKVGTSATGTVR
jgi:hypothetical protein